MHDHSILVHNLKGDAMPAMRISNAVANHEGVMFTGTRGDVVQQFQLLREALEDVEYSEFTTGPALMEAFGRHHSAVATAAGRALDAGQAGAKPVVVQSLL
jgi:hypothetical protein